MAKLDGSAWIVLSDGLSNKRREILTAMEVPGGVVLRTEQRWGMGGDNTAFSTCFVPGVRVQDGKLTAETAPRTAARRGGES